MTTSPVNANPDQLAQLASFLPRTLLIQGLPYQAAHMARGPLQTSANEYLAALKAAGVAPNAFHADGWDPAKIVVAALRALPPNATGPQLHDYIEQVHDFPGLHGFYDLRSGDQHGVSFRGSDFPFIRWDGTAHTWVVYDAPAAGAR